MGMCISALLYYGFNYITFLFLFKSSSVSHAIMFSILVIWLPISFKSCWTCFSWILKFFQKEMDSTWVWKLNNWPESDWSSSLWSVSLESVSSYRRNSITMFFFSWGLTTFSWQSCVCLIPSTCCEDFLMSCQVLFAFPPTVSDPELDGVRRGVFSPSWREDLDPWIWCKKGKDERHCLRPLPLTWIY